MPAQRILLALGSNLGDRRGNLRRALASLPPAVRVLRLSRLYETPPWGMTEQPKFLNQVIEAETELAPHDLLHFLKGIEQAMGRTPSARYGPRLIDLDILFHGDSVLETPDLVVPHARLHERAFVLVPLNDLAPDLVHPVLKQSIHSLLAGVKQKGIKPMNDALFNLQAEPALAWKLAVSVLGGDPDSAQAARAAEQVRASPRVAELLSERQADGRLPHHPYKKWNGAHWVLSILADLGFPPGDPSLKAMMDSVFDWLLSAEHARSIRVIAGRTRRCGSQEGNAAWTSLRLGFADARTTELVERLLKWQWQDGGWNCDKRPEADTSSFMETLLPLRALALYARASGDERVRGAAERAAEVFLQRKLFLRRRDGQVMDKHFVRLCYPAYWHYNILFGLKVMAEAGMLADPRCAPALDLLESRRLADGGFPADETYSRTSRPDLSGFSRLAWGGTGKTKLNPFVSADALAVLRLAGRA